MACLFSLGASEPPGVEYLIEQGLLPPAPDADQYTWESFARDEELVTTSTSVVWTQGGTVKRLLRFEQEGQPIIQATLTWFDIDRSDQQPSIGTATAKKLSRRALVVLLTEQAQIFFSDGSSHVVHLPCEIEQAFPTPKGVLLRRKATGTEARGYFSQDAPSAPPNSFFSPSGTQHQPSSVFSPSLSHQKPMRLATRRKSTAKNLNDFSIEVSADPEEDLPLYLTLTDPLLPIGLAVESLGPAQYTSSPYHHRTTSLETVALSNDEQLLYVSPSDELAGAHSTPSASMRPLMLCLTFNKLTNSYNIWYCSFQQTKSIISWKRQQAEASSRADQSAKKAQLLFQPSTSHRQSNARDSFGRPMVDPRSMLGSHSKARRSEKLQVEKNRKSEAFKPNLESPEKAKAANRRTSSMLARTELGSQTAAASFDWGHHGHAPGHGHRSSNRMPSFGRAQLDRRSFRTSQASARASFANMLDFDEDTSMQDDSVLGFSDLDEAKVTGYEDFFDMDLQDPFDDIRRDLMMLKVASFTNGSDSASQAAGPTKVVLLVNMDETPHTRNEDRYMSWLLLNKDSGVVTELRMPLDIVIRTVQEDLVAPRINQIEARSMPDILSLATVSDGIQRRAVFLTQAPQCQLLLYPGICGSSPNDGVPRLFQDTEELETPRTLTDTSATLLTARTYPQSRRDDNTVASSLSTSLKSRHNSSCLGIVSQSGTFQLLRFMLQPTNTSVSKIVEVCGHLLPVSNGGHSTMLDIFWSVQLRGDVSEWQRLMVALLTLFVPFLTSDASALKGPAASASDATQSPELETSGQRAVWQTLQGASQICTDLKSAVQAGTHLAANNLGEAHPMRRAPKEVCESLFSSLLRALHLLRQEELLDAASPENSLIDCPPMLSTLAQLGTWLGWREWGHESDWYLSASIKQQQPYFDTRRLQGLDCQPPHSPPPDISEWFVKSTSSSQEPFPRLGDTFGEASRASSAFNDTFLTRGRLADVDKRYTPRLATVVQAVSDMSGKPGEPLSKRRAHVMLQSLPDHLSVFLRNQLDVTDKTQSDLASDLGAGLQQSQKGPDTADNMQSASEADPLTVGELGAASSLIVDANRAQTVAAAPAMFSQNDTYHEGLRLLSCHIHPSGVLHSKPADSESKFLEAERAHAQLIGIRSTAVTTGTGLMDLQRICPLPTQELEIGLWETQIKMLPSGHIMTLSKDNFTEPKSAWAAYHTGVAAGLSVVRGISSIDHSWICLNKPQEPNNRHAGLLLGLGLNGYLSTMPRWLVFKYLTTKHEMTSISLLIGLAASHIGTMNTLVVKVLSIHLVSLLPAGAAELNLSSLVQTAGTMGVGLLYCNTHHRRMSEVMLSELEREDNSDNHDPSSRFVRDEGYRLSAGFALGLINLGQANDLRALYGMDVEQRLLAAATGPKDVDSAHFTDHAMAGSIVALALIYMKSGNRNLATKIGCPATRPRFDYIRPDVLLLRVLASNMIMWNEIEASDAWVVRNLPMDLQESVAGISEPLQRAQVLTGRCLKRAKASLHERMQTTKLHQYSVVAGLLWSIGLKYAGTGDLAARDFLLMYYDAMNALDETSTATYDNRLVYVALLRLQHLLLLAAAAVMSGTGDLHVLRRARIMHGTVNEHSTYGLHQASHMVIGALFLGQGRYAFGSSNLAVASLICAFYPLFPKDIMDNKAHLQAFRHLWVLAAEPRALLVRDEVTKSVVNLPVNIILNDGTIRSLTTPALLQPSLTAISKIELVSSEYCPAALDFADEKNVKQYRSTQTLWVRKRTLLAQYDNDPFDVGLAMERLQSLNVSGNTHQSSNLADWILESSAYRKMGLSRAELDSGLPRISSADRSEATRQPNERLTKLKRDFGERKRKIEHEMLKTMPLLAQCYAPSPPRDAETKHEPLEDAQDHLPPIESLLDIDTTKVDDILSISASAKYGERPHELGAIFAMSAQVREDYISEEAVDALRAGVMRQDAGLDDWLENLNEESTKQAPGLDSLSSTSSDGPGRDAAYQSIFADLTAEKADEDDRMDVDDHEQHGHNQRGDVSDEDWVR